MNKNTNLTKPFQQSHSGFTLIEVMVAAVILFSVIAAVSMVYRGAFLSSEKANGHVILTGILPALLANIRDDIRSQGNYIESKLSKSSNIWSVEYNWQAKLIMQERAPKKLDVDTGSYITPPLKYKLWLVDLEVKNQASSQKYQFYEMSWNDE